MFNVFVENINKNYIAEENISLMDFIRKNNLYIDAPCNGLKICRKCGVLVDGAFQYACEYIIEKDISINLKENKNLTCVELEEKLEKNVNPDIYFKELGDIDSKSALSTSEQLHLEHYDMDILSKIGELEDRKQYEKFSGLFYNDKLIDIVSRDDKNILGVAVDIGTTGISVCLVDLMTGEIFNSVSSLNPQVKYGADVITRISYIVSEENGLTSLQKSVLDGISILIEKALEKNGLDKSDIYRIIIGANNIMLHIFAGISPVSISKYPYRPVFIDPVDIGKNLLPMNPSGVITLLSSISGYIGSDITSGLYATNFFDLEGNTLFIDIGTNGEMVLNINGKYYGTSTAAGPALEGMNIDCGIRAIDGAIEEVFVKGNSIEYKTIGGGDAIGICGSGLIDLMATLVDLKIVDRNGKFIKSDKIIDKKFYLNESIFISQKDIRQIQLAKSAIATGIEFLLESANVEYEEIDTIIIAGAFGYHLNFESLQKIGIISPKFKGEIKFLGNTSLYGAALSLLQRDAVDYISNISKNIQVVELAESDEFQEVFLRELLFNYKDE